jgi:hypothetical protein
MDGRIRTPIISRTCHDPEFVLRSVDHLLESFESGDPSTDAEETFQEMLLFCNKVQNEMLQDLYTARSVFNELLASEARGKPR